MTNIPPSENSYVVDQESATEMARLIDQDAMVSRQMGGLFPPDIDQGRVHDVLDIACGPGGWAMEVAFEHPDKHVVGIDISQAMLEYATAQANMQNLQNIEFFFMDATASLEFPAASFDLINIRFIVGLMWKEIWPELIKECKRILRPGGILRITDTDDALIGANSSEALEKLSILVTRAFYRTGRSFAVDEWANHFGLTPMLSNFLLEAGFTNIREVPHMLDYSAGAPAHFSHTHNLEVAMYLIQPFLRNAGIASQEELEQLYEQMLIDLRQDEFFGIWTFMSTYGEKSA
ncbi:class I SAM-dependent methyltransferase [Ktedonosporobacter rubrisoli]|uniref:Class I SAM-dependent methyltransferase n=1 Tax=Ktedonosporobacter rubrisoli TaxID=2509675 RepID=A0A4V0YYF9_KTERU|nr:class I SAM-dependent methyltransferase [Ktedonosporobacter rubrisoli]QBD76081.1 class I SAM-dependent methyltransferase [Ktedonosporobacter rubrisoli]